MSTREIHTRPIKPKNESPRTFEKLEKRYPETDFDQRLISGSQLKALLFDGQVEQEVIRKELDESPSFATPGSEPAWKTLGHLEK